MIVSPRARWIIAFSLFAAALGIFRQQPLVVGFALTCILWIAFEWFVFRCQLEWDLQRIRIRRQVLDRHGPARILWEQRPCEVTVDVELPNSSYFPALHFDLRDILPVSAESVEGQHGVSFSSGASPDLSFRYVLCPTVVGTLHLVGFRLLVQDVHGFFQSEHFIDVPRRLRVLPWAGGIGAVVPTKKRHNALSPPGVHRVARPGAGSELLEIRDYVPGDSPRSIAWKVSAKRGALMCKQFENEVPVRCHLLVDVSSSVRLGYPGPSSASRLVSLTATIADTLVSHRDPVGFALVDGATVSLQRPSANRKTMLRMVDRLAAAVDQPLPPVAAPSASLLEAAFDVARIRRPALLDEAGRGFRLMSVRPSRRKKLHIAAFLCGYYELPSNATASMLEADEVLSRWLQRFLAEHQAPYRGSLFDQRGNYLFDDRDKIASFAKLIQRAVLHGQDNELFVVIAELCDPEYDLRPLLKAIKVARARHHRVMILCAWPPGVPTRNESSDNTDSLLSDPASRADVMSDVALYALQHRQAAFVKLQREVGRLRVPVAPASATTAPKLVLSQLELIRAGRVVA